MCATRVARGTQNLAYVGSLLVADKGQLSISVFSDRVKLAVFVKTLERDVKILLGDFWDQRLNGTDGMQRRMQELRSHRF